MNEKRSADRTQANIPGRLVSDRLNLSCMILDLSPTGARLQIEPGHFLPKLLSLKAKELGKDRPVEVVWRNKTQLGVRF